MVLGGYWLSILIQIGIFSIAALGLNILVGFTGQISIGHAAFFLLGAFTSAYISNNAADPGVLRDPARRRRHRAGRADLRHPAARLKGLYLVDRDAGGAIHPARLLLPRRMVLRRLGAGQRQAVLDLRLSRCAATGNISMSCWPMWWRATSWSTNLMRTRDGRALVAVRDHYLSAEIMGINLTKYRTLSFGLAAFFAGIAGALYAHYQLVVSQEGFRHRALDPVPRHDHHRRHRFDHGHADGHRLRGAAAGIDGMSSAAA